MHDPVEQELAILAQMQAQAFQQQIELFTQQDGHHPIKLDQRHYDFERHRLLNPVADWLETHTPTTRLMANISDCTLLIGAMRQRILLDDTTQAYLLFPNSDQATLFKLTWL